MIDALGARFDDRARQADSSWAPSLRSRSPTSDPRICKNRTADVPIVGDAREVLADLVQAVQSTQGNTGDYSAVEGPEPLARDLPLRTPWSGASPCGGSAYGQSRPRAGFGAGAASTRCGGPPSTTRTRHLAQGRAGSMG
ncbi:hypothetical protein SCALM49S_00561 [Streptomyces californicus]